MSVCLSECVCMSVCVCANVCVCVSTSHLCAGAHGGPGTGITGNCGCWELNSVPVKEQQVPLSAEPTLQPCQWLLVVHLVTAVKRVIHHTKYELSPDICQGLSSQALISHLIIMVLYHGGFDGNVFPLLIKHIIQKEARGEGSWGGNYQDTVCTRLKLLKNK